jgi:hypothetical protein
MIFLHVFLPIFFNIILYFYTVRYNLGIKIFGLLHVSFSLPLATWNVKSNVDPVYYEKGRNQEEASRGSGSCKIF